MTLKEAKEKIDVLELTISSMEDYIKNKSEDMDKEIEHRVKNINKRCESLETNYGKLATKYNALFRRIGIAESDFLALNGSIMTMGGEKVSNFKTLPGTTNPLLPSGVTHGSVFENNNATEPTEPEPDLFYTGIDLMIKEKTCQIKL